MDLNLTTVVLAGGHATRMPNKVLMHSAPGKSVGLAALDYAKTLSGEEPLVVVRQDSIPHRYYFACGHRRFAMQQHGDVLEAMQTAARAVPPGTMLIFLCADNVYPVNEINAVLSIDNSDIPNGAFYYRRVEPSLLSHLHWYDPESGEIGRGWSSSSPSWKDKQAITTPWMFSRETVLRAKSLNDLLLNAARIQGISGWWDLGTDDALASYLVNEIRFTKTDNVRPLLNLLPSDPAPPKAVYPWFTGKHPSSSLLADVHAGCQYTLWHPLSGGDARPDAMEYVRHVASLDIRFEKTGMGALVVLEERSSKKVQVHGDLTLENIIVGTNGLQLIDPGRPRGLYIREVDEAKLMQSVTTHWETVKLGWEPKIVERLPWDTSLIHLALLTSHWIRLVRWQPQVAWYATAVIEECFNEWNRANETGTEEVAGRRCGWSPVGLSKRCLQLLS